MPRIIPVLGALALALQLGTGRGAGELPLPAPDESPPPGGCGAGCSAEPPAGDRLAPWRVRRLLVEYADERIGAASPALETLLFHAPEVREHLARAEDVALDAQRRAFLDRELGRTHATLELRIVDADGVERLRLGPRRVLLGGKQHLHPDATERFQPPEISFTVRRVGLEHLWARL